ncbi:O-fucosyltransferase family protein [Arabidopsis thaliana]|uniref:O-fucosyltransferase 30 n=1 Tax=Arabidopsis thaliana TaxID=3702 RepID=OFT30_ARATH|eukprot:NP_193473.1 O-fucosyltransferase family protein [Arabidopsis thaliana]
MNNFFNPSRPSPRPWPNRKKQTDKSAIFLCSVSILVVFFIVVFFITYSEMPKSLFSISAFSGSVQFPQCRSEILTRTLLGQKFLWYAPHSGFSNQLSEFKNALLMAGILNRTLIIPPILDHHAVALGSCPKFRVLSPSEIRISVWNHSIELLKTDRYVSMADIVDISSLVSSSAVRVIDFRYFASLQCGVDLETLCTDDLAEQSQAYESLKQCGYLLSGVRGNVDKCLYAVDEDCRTTVWTYKNGEADGRLDSFQPDEKLKKKKKLSNVRRRRDVYKTLGHGTEAESAAILAFGSLFTAPYKGSELYIDIHKSPKIKSLVEKVDFLPFVREIMIAGKKFASETIKAPFLCAQLRLLDGQFKNHRESTFTGLYQKLEALSVKNPGLINVFVMTDLPEFNWTGTYLGDLSKNSTNFKLHFIGEQDEFLARTEHELDSASHGQKFGSIPMSLDSIKKMQTHCYPHGGSNVQLYIEEAVCSCASLGFVGTPGSTIADSVEMMRKYNACSSS